MLDARFQRLRRFVANLNSRQLLRLRLMLFFYVGTMPALAAPAGGTPYPASAMADGHPWNMTTVANGRTVTITLNPDGTGTIAAGLMSRSPTWHGTADGICIKVAAPRPERCVGLQSRLGGFDGVENGRVVFEIRR